jgi:hypothetical protein
MASIIGAGDMDIPVKFYKNNSTVDEFGATSLQAELFLSTYCHVKYIGTPSAGASEEFINDQKTGKVKVEITTRFVAGIDFDDFFELEEANFNIYSIHIIGRRQALVIRGESRDDQSDVPGKVQKTLFIPNQIGVLFEHMHFPVTYQPETDTSGEPIVIEIPSVNKEENWVPMYYKANQQAYIDDEHPPVISSAKMYVDGEFHKTLPLRGTEYLHNDVFIGYRIVPLPEDPPDPPVDPPEEPVQLLGAPSPMPKVYYSYTIVGKNSNTIVCDIKAWNGKEYKSFEYRQDVTVAGYWRYDKFARWVTTVNEVEYPYDGSINVNDEVKWKTNSSQSLDKINIIKDQPWKFYLNDPFLVSNKKDGILYRIISPTWDVWYPNTGWIQKGFNFPIDTEAIVGVNGAYKPWANFGWFPYVYVPKPVNITVVPGTQIRMRVEAYVGDDASQVRFNGNLIENGVVSFMIILNVVY